MKSNLKRKKELVEVLTRVAKDKLLLEAFLEDILSPKELIDIANRWQIVKQLDKGISQRNIVSNLKVSISKVTRGSRELLDPNGGFKKALQYES